MTMQIHTTAPITALNFEKSQVGGPITKVVGATSVNASDDVTSLDDRLRVAEELRVALQLPDVAALLVHQHGEELGANQRWQQVGSGGLGQHRHHRHPAGQPNSWPVGTSGTIESVNGVDQAWVGCDREPAVIGCPNILLLTDPCEVL